jgi:hypothetical protein
MCRCDFVASADLTFQSGCPRHPGIIGDQIEELLLDDNLDGAQLRAEVLDIVGSTRPRQPRRRSIDQRLRKLPAINWDAEGLYEDADSTDH